MDPSWMLTGTDGVSHLEVSLKDKELNACSFFAHHVTDKCQFE